MERIEEINLYDNLIVEYCLLLFVILWSGGYATYGLWANWPYVLFIISLGLLLKRGLRIEKGTHLVIAFLAIISVFQSLIFSGSITTTIIQPIIRLYAIAMVAVIVRPNMNHVFISISTTFAFISLIFWGLDITPDGHSLLLSIAKGLPQYGAKVLNEQNYEDYGRVYTLFFYTIPENPIDSIGFLVRNSGPFFEPGRFTIILTLSLALILFSGSYKRYKIPFYIILLTNFTTLSTTGYLSMIVLFAGYYANRSGSGNLKNAILFIIIIIGSYFIMGLSFMGEKISVALGDTDVANTRFGAMFYHWLQIKQSPWIGYGPFLETVFPSLEMSPCGITDMMRRWGIPTFIVCVWLLFKGTRVYIHNTAIYRITVVTILIFMAYTQTIMNEPLYYLLYFIGSEEELFENGDFEEEDFVDGEVNYTENDTYPEGQYYATKI